ncbi:MAG: hypothetical protein QM802_17580 [Agriterribacter sp.]
MAEIKLPRLLAAAKEFNIGQDTLIDFLIGKGFPKDDLKPTSKLTEDMYYSLQQEFSSDKAAKAKSDQIEIPKGNMVEARKKKDEEEILFKKDAKKKADATPPVADTVQTPTAPVEVPVEKAPEPQPEITKIEAPELEGPKILDKIDLSTIDSSTRPKKGIKKKSAEPEVEESKEPVQEEVIPEAKVEIPVVAEEEETEEEEIEETTPEEEEGPLLKISGRRNWKARVL